MSNEFTHEIDEPSHSRNGSGDGTVQEVSHISSSKNAQTKEKQIYTKTSRKRQRNPGEWKKKKAANRREAGESYISYKGNVIPAKSIKMGILCHDKCRLNCTNTFTEEIRESILKSFYKLNVDAKNALLFNNIEKVPIKRTRKGAVKHKSSSYKYMVTSGGVRIRVCKKALANLYQISLKKIEIIQTKIKSGATAPQPDKRGKHNVRPNKTSEDIKASVIEHILKFPAEESHYSRHCNMHKKYLSPLLSVSKMHKLYIEESIDSKLPEKFCKVKESYYRHIFVTHFNLSFGQPKSDTCSTCDSGEKTEEHIENFQAACEAMRSDRELAESDSKVAYLTVDLQQTMPLPRLSTSKAFYLRQAWFYNLGIHITTKEGSRAIFCTWTEDQAKRGSSEVLSSLLTAFELDEQLKSKEHIIIWSDSCSGQNKNFLMICLYQYLINKGSFKTIDHKFPEVGHTYLDSDRHFGRIEKVLRKHQNIYLPEQYRSIIGKSSRKSLVIDMSNHFRKTDDLMTKLKLFNRKKDILKESVRFRDGVRWIRVEEYGYYFFKESYDPYTPFRQVNIRRYMNQEASLEDISISRLFEKTGELSQEKKENLKEQLRYIKEEYRWYYNILINE